MATLSAKEAARELGTDARTFRKFMRAITPKEDQPGQGNRYHIEARSVKGLKKKFDEWSKSKVKPETPPADEAIEVDVDTVEEELVEEDDGTEDIEDELEEDAEPTAEDLEELEGLDDLDFDLEEL